MIYFIIFIINIINFTESFADVLIQPIEPYSAEIDIKKIKKLDGLNISVAKNEFESASFYLKNNSETPVTVSIEATGLINDKAEVIDAGAIDIKYLIEWYQSNGAWKTHRQTKENKFEPFLVRELLVKNPDLIRVDRERKINSVLIGKEKKKYFEIRKDVPKTKNPIEVSLEKFYITDSSMIKPIKLNGNQVVQVWLTFKPFKDVQAGTYKGKIIIKERLNVINSHNLRLEIHDFELDEAHLTYSIYYRGHLSKQGSISSEAKSEEQLRAEFLNMQEHGVSSPSVYQRIMGKTGKISEKEVHHLFERYMQIRHESGISNKTIYYLGLQTGGQKNKKEIDGLNYGLFRLKRMLKKFGATDVYIYGKEEVKGRELTRQIPLWVDTKAKGYKVFVAGYKGFFERIKNMADLLIYYGKIDPYASDEAHRHNTKIFSYNNPQVGIENPSVYRKNYGFVLIAAGFDGVMDYAYQHAMGFIWNDFDNKVYRDSVFAYPTANGVIDTLAWEAFREAVDDARYYSTALNKLKKKQGEGSEKMLRKWLRSQCSISQCNSEYIRNQLIRMIEEN